MSVGTTSGHGGTLMPNPPPGRLGPNHDEFLSPKRRPLEHSHAESGSRRTPISPNNSVPISSSSEPSSPSPSSTPCPHSSLDFNRGVCASPVSMVTAPLEADDADATDDELEAQFQKKLASRGWKPLKRQRDARSASDVPDNNKIPRLAETVRVHDHVSESSQSTVNAALLPTPGRNFRQGLIEPADPVALAANESLEVDEGFCDEDGEEYAWRDSSIDLLRLPTPNGFRQLGPLRYRGSGQYTSRIQPVVRSRPRMRKRKDPPVLSAAGPSTEGSN